MRGREEIEEDAQDGEGRDGEDHAGQPTYLPAADHGQEYDYRVQVERLALDARREEVALELLDQDVGHHRQHGDGGGFEDQGHDDRRYRPEEGPHAQVLLQPTR
jgi:hypothetical protein